jgi:hypothetical protein
MLVQTLSINFVAEMLAQDEHAGWYKDIESCRALAVYMEDLSHNTGEPVEVDVVAWRCGFSLYEDIADFNSQTGQNAKNMDDVGELADVIELTNGRFIVRDF